MSTIHRQYQSGYQPGDYIFIDKREYNRTRNQLNRMYNISHALFNAYYGEDYYLPISGSTADVYEYLANDLISDLNKKKRNKFYKLWTKIKKLMKW